MAFMSMHICVSEYVCDCVQVVESVWECVCKRKYIVCGCELSFWSQFFNNRSNEYLNRTDSTSSLFLLGLYSKPAMLIFFNFLFFINFKINKHEVLKTLPLSYSNHFNKITIFMYFS